jgi:hypothetical protein
MDCLYSRESCLLDSERRDGFAGKPSLYLLQFRADTPAIGSGVRKKLCRYNPQTGKRFRFLRWWRAMSIQGIGGSSIYQALTYKASRQTQSAASANTVLGSTSNSENVDQEFLDYMKKSPGQRMIDEWLKAHNLTEQDLAAMSPEKRDAILKQMAEDIKNKMKQKTDTKLVSTIDVLA